MFVGGASLQTASVMYSIPKTVLWRRVQKDIGSYALSRRARLRQRYLPHAKEAAVRALQNGERFNKVALQYKVDINNVLTNDNIFIAYSLRTPLRPVQELWTNLFSTVPILVPSPKRFDEMF